MSKKLVLPCDCGAEDCKRCFPFGCEDEEDEREEDSFPDPDDTNDDDIADYVCEGYRDSPL